MRVVIPVLGVAVATHHVQPATVCRHGDTGEQKRSDKCERARDTESDAGAVH